VKKRAIWSFILILLAIAAVLLIGNAVGALIAAILFVVMLFLWAIPSYPASSAKKSRRPDWKPLSLAFAGIGVGLVASIAAVLILPPRLFPWVLMAVGIGIIVWIFMSRK
jgi:hypothetical protein